MRTRDVIGDDGVKGGGDGVMEDGERQRFDGTGCEGKGLKRC